MHSHIDGMLRAQDGIRHGVGTYEWPNGARYRGEWRAGTMHGVGVLDAANGATYQARWGGGAGCRGAICVAWAARCTGVLVSAEPSTPPLHRLLHALHTAPALGARECGAQHVH